MTEGRATPPAELGAPAILRFWLPLLATWLLMAVEGPLIAALIARLPSPKANLAAYGVAFAIGLVMEAPIIMMMAAAVRLVKDRESFAKLKRFAYTLSLATTAMMLLILVPSIYAVWAVEAIGLPPDVADLTYWAIWLLLPWPGAIGYRRFYQGVLIGCGRTRIVTYGTITRVAATMTMAFGLDALGSVPGAWLGAAANASGVVVEAAAVRWLGRHAVAAARERPPHPGIEPLRYRAIARFYYPLALTALLGLVVQPLVTLALGKARMPLESLAVLPVVNSLVFAFRAISLSFQEVVISLMGQASEGYRALRRFATRVALVQTTGITLLAGTPLGLIWFHDVSGLSAELARFAMVPLAILVPMPALSMLLNWQRGVLMHVRETSPITVATILEVGTIIAALAIATHHGVLAGAAAAAIALVLGRLGSVGYLARFARWSRIPPHQKIAIQDSSSR